MQDVSQVILERLNKALPPVFTRTEICKHLGGLFTPGGLANLDCIGQGAPRIRSGRSVVYEKVSFLAWLERRFSKEVSHD